MTQKPVLVRAVLEDHLSRQRRASSIPFDAIRQAAERLGVPVPANMGEFLTAARYAPTMSVRLPNKTPRGFQWALHRTGVDRCAAKLVRRIRIEPGERWHAIPTIDLTPSCINEFVTDERQALLAKVRYNRLIDMFLGLTAYSLQSHLRATVPEIGQIETDELYVGVSKSGQQFVIPVQAKGGNDQLGTVQIEQDLALCRHLFPELTARPVAVQFKREGNDNTIVMFDLGRNDDEEVCIREERHYRLVPANEITTDDLVKMAT